MVVGSYVVNAMDAGPVGARRIRAIHWGVLGSLLVVVSLAVVVLQRRMDQSEPFRQMNGDARMIEKLPGIQRASVRDLLLHTAGNPGAKKVLRATITLSGGVAANQDAVADQTAHLLLQNDRNAQGYDDISIRVFHGYDIGIASHWNHSEFIHTPREWSQSAVGSFPAGVPASTSQ